jgi:hypothetical protein
MMMVVSGDDDIDNNVVDGHNDDDGQEQLIPQRTSSRSTKGGIHSYAEEELDLRFLILTTTEVLLQRAQQKLQRLPPSILLQSKYLY